MIQRIPIESRDQWLALRKQDVTASAVGALFDLHPYVSRYGLFAEKTGLEVPDEMSAMLEWRLILESAVGAAVERQRPGWRIVKATEYLRDPDLRLGATPDFYIEGDPRGLGILQAKTAAPSSFAKTWTDDSPPFWIALQNSTEMMLEPRVKFGAVACLIIDPWRLECPIYEIPRHDGVESRIREAVGNFWSDVEFGVEPEPDYAKDAELIAALYPATVPLKQIDLSGDNHLPVLLTERADIKARGKTDELRLKEIDAEVKFKMADAEIAKIDGFTITNKVTHRKGYEVQPTSYRALRITDHREKEQADDGRF